jgi:hypothetical protein
LDKNGEITIDFSISIAFEQFAARRINAIASTIIESTASADDFIEDRD